MPVPMLRAEMIGPELFLWFCFLTVAFLVLCGIVLRASRTVGSRLIALGILAAVASIGYGGFITSPTIIPLASGMMKIAVMLVLAGVACSVLPALSSTDTTKPQEPVHE